MHLKRSVFRRLRKFTDFREFAIIFWSLKPDIGSDFGEDLQDFFLCGFNRICSISSGLIIIIIIIIITIALLISSKGFSA